MKACYAFALVVGALVGALVGAQDTTTPTGETGLVADPTLVADCVDDLPCFDNSTEEDLKECLMIIMDQPLEMMQAVMKAFPEGLPEISMPEMEMPEDIDLPDMGMGEDMPEMPEMTQEMQEELQKAMSMMMLVEEADLQSQLAEQILMIRSYLPEERNARLQASTICEVLGAFEPEADEIGFCGMPFVKENNYCAVTCGTCETTPTPTETTETTPTPTETTETTP